MEQGTGDRHAVPPPRPRLFAQLTSQPRFESERKFFRMVVEDPLSSAGEGNAKVPQVTLSRNGRGQIARRAAG